MTDGGRARKGASAWFAGRHEHHRDHLVPGTDLARRPAAGRGPGGGVRIVRAEVPSPEFSRFLYAAVGGDIRWTDRLGWTPRAVARSTWTGRAWRPGSPTTAGTPAGYVELEPQDDGVVEIVYFGLLPAFRGRRHRRAPAVVRRRRGPGTWRTAGRGGRRPSGSGCTHAARTASTRWTTTCAAASALRHQGRGGARGDRTRPLAGRVPRLTCADKVRDGCDRQHPVSHCETRVSTYWTKWTVSRSP